MKTIQTPLPKLLTGLITVSIIVWWMALLQEVLVLLSFSILFAMVLFPLCSRLEKWGLPRIFAIFICLCITFGLILGLIVFASQQIGEFSTQLPVFQQKALFLIDKVQLWASENFNISRRKQTLELKNQSINLLKNSGSLITNALSTTVNSLSYFLIVPLFVFFLLLYRDFFKHFFYKIFSQTPNARIDKILTEIYTVVKSYVLGLLIVILIVAALNTAGLLALGIDYAVFFGFLAAFLLLIPYVGIMIGSLLPILMALLTKESPMYAVGVAGIFVFVQFLEGNFITPFIVGSKIRINPLAAMIALILGGQLWGISGLILALPYVAILNVIFANIDSLKPYCYLLGEPDEYHMKKNSSEKKV